MLGARGREIVEPEGQLDRVAAEVGVDCLGFRQAAELLGISAAVVLEADVAGGAQQCDGQVAVADAIGILLVATSQKEGPEGSVARAAGIATGFAGVDLLLGAVTYASLQRTTVASTTSTLRECSAPRPSTTRPRAVRVRLGDAPWRELGALAPNTDGVYELPGAEFGRALLERPTPTAPLAAAVQVDWPVAPAGGNPPRAELQLPDAWKAWECAALSAPDADLPTLAPGVWQDIAGLHAESCPAGATVARSRGCSNAPRAADALRAAKSLFALADIATTYRPDALHAACPDDRSTLEDAMVEQYRSATARVVARATGPADNGKGTNDDRRLLTSLDNVSTSMHASSTRVGEAREAAWAALTGSAAARGERVVDVVQAWKEGGVAPLATGSPALAGWRTAATQVGKAYARQDPTDLVTLFASKAPTLGNLVLQSWVKAALGDPSARDSGASTVDDVEAALKADALVAAIALTDTDRAALAKQALDARRVQATQGCPPTGDTMSSKYHARAYCLEELAGALAKRHDSATPAVNALREQIWADKDSARSLGYAAEKRENAAQEAAAPSSGTNCASANAMCNTNCAFLVNVTSDPFAAGRCKAECMSEQGCWH